MSSSRNSSKPRRRLCKENLEHGDLKRLIEPRITLDEFKSKMGNDEDIVVIRFEARDEEPGQDLVSFIEKGYEWVLDAECAEGEELDGNYHIFVEADRESDLPKRLVELIKDITNLTGDSISDWDFTYRKSKVAHPLTLADLNTHLPLTPEAYERKFGEDEPEEEEEVGPSEEDELPAEENPDDLDQLKAAAGVKVDTKAPVNDFTESLRRAAGIR